MDDDHKALRSRVVLSLGTTTRRASKAISFVKLSLVVGGGLLTSVAALMPTGLVWPLPTSAVLGLGGTFMVAVGSIAMGIFERDNSQDIIDAHAALEKEAKTSNEFDEVLRALEEYEDAVEKLQHLHASFSVSRGTIERAILENSHDETKIIETCLETSQRALAVALGFQLRDIWTIGVYRFEASKKGHPENVLRLIATRRSVPCSVEDAREWPKGVGIGGIAFAKNDEVVMPDLTDTTAGTAFRLENGKMKAEDRVSYRSMFAVPVSVGKAVEPWGVVVATSNRPGHFGQGMYSGVAPEEAVRVLAGVVALAVAVARAGQAGLPKIGSDERGADGHEGTREKIRSSKPDDVGSGA